LTDLESAKAIEAAISSFFKTMQAYLGDLMKHETECEYCRKAWEKPAPYGIEAMLARYEMETGMQLASALTSLCKETRKNFLPWLAQCLCASEILNY